MGRRTILSLKTFSREPFLDHGEVILRDVMGDDLTVVNAARVSFNARSEEMTKGDKRLLKFLEEGDHWSPFAHPQISLEIYVPGMVLDQVVKHRIGMMYSDDAAFVAYENSADNQLSMRYKSPVDFYVPEFNEWREAPENKKQGSGPENLPIAKGAAITYSLRDIIRHGVGAYNAALEEGVAPEQARLLLPYYAMYTRRYWTTSLMGVIRFLGLREKPDAQYEIRQLAGAVHRLVEPHFRESFRAYGLTNGE
jgi:thymidylate synthase (FAD)